MHSTTLSAPRRDVAGNGARVEQALRILAARSWLVYGSATLALVIAIALAVTKFEVDIAVYLMGGRHALGPSLYTVDLPHRPFLVFTYPPFAALAFWPLAHLLTERADQVLWALVNVAALFGILTTCLRVVRPQVERPERRRWALLLMLPAVALNPVFLTIGLGQVDLVLCWLVLADVFGPRRIGRMQMPLGVGIGIAAAIKLTPLIFIPYLFVTGRRRGALTATATFLGCSALALAATRRASWIYWTRDVHLSQRAGALLDLSDQNLRSALIRFAHGPVPGAVLWPLAVAVAVGGLALAAWAHARTSDLLGLLIAADVGLLVSPITWTHHMVWVLPVLLWLTLSEGAPRFGTWIAAGVLALFWLPPTWSVPTSWWPSADPIELHEHGWQLVAGNSFFLVTATFLVAIGLFLWRRHDLPSPKSFLRLLRR
jgi:alpha-1,2-mannosyltransferase